MPDSDIPADTLAAPTIGAWRRAHNHQTWTPEARHLYAVTIGTEAQRAILTDRLDSIAQFLRNGATPDQTVARLSAIVADWHTL